jgi:ankyrin repeat protein
MSIDDKTVSNILQVAGSELADSYLDDEFEDDAVPKKSLQPIQPNTEKMEDRPNQGMSRSEILKRASQSVATQEKRDADKYFESISATALTSSHEDQQKKISGQSSVDDYDDGSQSSSDDDYDESSDVTQNLASRLLYYCSQEDLPSVKSLIREREGGENLVRHAKDKHAWTALHWAASRGNVELVNVLIGAVSTKTRKRKFINKADDIAGFTPLHLAAIGSHLRCVEILLEQGADKKTKNKIGRLSVLKFLLEFYFNVIIY